MKVKKLLFFLIFLFSFCIQAGATGIVNVWEKDYETTTWNHIDLFDYKKEMADYQYHLRGFKETDDSYIIVLKGGDKTDEIIKISKEGELIKKITFNPRTTTSSNYIIEDDYIIAANIVTGTDTFILKLQKYDYNLELISESEHQSGKSFLIKKILFNDEKIQLLTLSNNILSLNIYDYNFEEIETKENIAEFVYKNCLFNESTLTFGSEETSIIFDSLTGEITTFSTNDFEAVYYQYVAEKYPQFYGDNKHIGENYYYIKNNDTYEVYTMSDKLITTDDNRYFYDLHGKLAVAQDYQNNSFDIYNSSGELEMSCNMFVITSDGFLTLTKQTDEEGNVISTTIERYKIQYNVTKEETTNGEIVVQTGNHDVNDLITIEIKPDEGYVLDELIIKDMNGNEISYDENYSFLMPGSDITITATYKEITKEIEENPETGWSNVLKDICIIVMLSSIIILLMKNYNKFKKI